jgi:hypothetical protein
MMETFWCNEEGLRPSEQRIDPSSARIHEVQYYRQSLRFLGPDTRGNSHSPMRRNKASTKGLNTPLKASTDTEITNKHNGAIKEVDGVEKIPAGDEAQSPHPCRLLRPDLLGNEGGSISGMAEQAIVGEGHHRETSDNILSRAEAGLAHAAMEPYNTSIISSARGRGKYDV